MTTRITGIDQVANAAAGADTNARHDEQSGYGLGFDQHSAHSRGRPIAWVVVAIIVAATCGCGAALILAAPWLFWVGVAVAAIGTVVGRATHAFRDASSSR